jgi:hypothetical protein
LLDAERLFPTQIEWLRALVSSGNGIQDVDTLFGAFIEVPHDRRKTKMVRI